MKFQDYILQIYEFFRQNGVQVDPVPQVNIDYSDVNLLDPFIRTGNYNSETKAITLFVKNRQLKDILRSFCHELIHHNQNITDPVGFKLVNKSGNLAGNAELEKIEADAYSRGNVMFRKWTETYSK